MFNKDFYPTPRTVAMYMVGGNNLNGKTILEPSAGKGDLVDYFNENGATCLSCEIEPELAKIVARKSKFLKPDFINVTRDEISHIDCIYMNPPFSADEQHILHAWEIAPDGCEIVSLCNYATLKNPISINRTILKRLIEMYGTSEDVGQVFKDSERPTNVDIGLVRLQKPSSENEFEGYFTEESDEVEEQANALISYNAVRDCVSRYIHACQLYDEVAENAIKMNNLVGMFGASKMTFILQDSEKETAIQDFKIALKKSAWLWIFQQMKMNKFMTEKLKSEINKFVEKQQTIPFTMKNIYKMMEMVVGTHGNRMSKVLEEVFDNFTMHHHENRYGVEGWKTNSRYMINKKIIVNNVSEIGWSGGCQIKYQGQGNKMDDLCRALTFLTGEHENLVTLYGFYRAKDTGKVNEDNQKIYEYKFFGEWYDWGFFQVKVFKKGTLHAKFKDDKVWEMFNREVSKIKGFQLPDKI